MQAQPHNLDEFVALQKHRAEMAESLRVIAGKFPDLIIECARFLSPNAVTADAAGGTVPVSEKASQPRQSTESYDASPTVAIKQWLRRHPTGGTFKEMADDILNGIESASRKPRNLLYGTLASMERRGKVASLRDKDGTKRFALPLKSRLNGIPSEKESAIDTSGDSGES